MDACHEPGALHSECPTCKEITRLRNHLAEREAWFEKCIAMWKEEEVLWKEREAELLATLGMKWAGTKPA